MRKLLLVLVLFTLVLTLISCDDNDSTLSDEKVFVPNSSLVDDLAGQVKEVFED
ncbi:hypothetical protein [Mariniplasma anaerobium]|uniref:Lipoprotein n=1 Tax=Mariniplasma anaerobium TaxID=2735436 RepID=A0A7U9XUS5_9MOLU|nr:hypothetical protein [Mariniplasma anaerobium]BCR35908.1 hypothetical protein MPAN_008010 [Mariniplasma anaerobium]